MADLIKIPHYLLKTEGTFIGKRNGSIQTRIKDDLYKKLFQTRSSWLNCALRGDEAVYWVSIGQQMVGTWWY